jgi:hypothetical protein
MGIAVSTFFVQPNHFQKFANSLCDLGGREAPVHPQWFSDDPADGVPGVQRGIRVLKDDLHLLAQLPHALRLAGQYVYIVEPDLA